MVQRYRPAIVNGEPTCVPDQQFGLFVTYEQYQLDITTQATQNTEKFNQEQGNFFSELDRLEETNKNLHAEVKELKRQLEQAV